MKKHISISLFLFFSFNIFAQNVKLTVKVKNIPNNKGQVAIALYKDKKSFPKRGEEYKGIFLKANSNGVSYTFTVPKGIYAVACFHDLNKDKKLNTNLVGLPVEDYGFSNNVYGTFGPPYFSSVSVNTQANKTITIYVK